MFNKKYNFIQDCLCLVAMQQLVNLKDNIIIYIFSGDFHLNIRQKILHFLILLGIFPLELSSVYLCNSSWNGSHQLDLKKRESLTVIISSSKQVLLSVWAWWCFDCVRSNITSFCCHFKNNHFWYIVPSCEISLI